MQVFPHILAWESLLLVGLNMASIAYIRIPEKFPPGKVPTQKSSHPEVATWKCSHPKSSNGGKVPKLKKKFFFV